MSEEKQYLVHIERDEGDMVAITDDLCNAAELEYEFPWLKPFIGFIQQNRFGYLTLAISNSIISVRAFHQDTVTYPKGDPSVAPGVGYGSRYAQDWLRGGG